MWSAKRRLDYFVLLGVKNKRAEYTQNFGGEASPEPESVTAVAQEQAPLVKLLYMLSKFGDDICLDAPTARSITGEPSVAHLIEVLNSAAQSKLVKRATEKPLTESDRDSMVGLTLTQLGKEYVSNALHGSPSTTIESATR